MMGAEYRLLVCDDWRDYELLDSGDGRKLERFGAYRFERPDAQAMWRPQKPITQWTSDAVFASQDDEEERGAWTHRGQPPPREWPIAWNGVTLNARCAAFRHMGVFPEHSVHWRWAMDRIQAAGRPVRLLNLFGYTGMMSLAAAKAGAEVVHLDASAKSIGQGRENQSLSGLDDKPIRWICDDAMKFVEREMRRGRRYDAIVLDPPKFGRGPKNEIWKFEEGFSDLLAGVRALLSETPLFVIATVYAVRLSYISVAQTVSTALDGLGGDTESGEMAILESGRGFVLPTGLYARWSAAGTDSP
ncbi:MAG: class I SAM-dependent methyltransferase [Alphaproteobacteria bacterium]|nr:class I SAM-dependent methyltransferase [Alphaproteobacteria bacterium]